MHNFLLKEITFYTKIKKCFVFPIHLFLMPQCVNMRFQDSYVNIVRHHNYIYILNAQQKAKETSIQSRLDIIIFKSMFAKNKIKQNNKHYVHCTD